uniref:Uncharacterized protein n=1 Tax=Cacopsylla melanoneura TaxID=428564 RepID=A0A8D8W6A6_9HEMI
MNQKISSEAPVTSTSESKRSNSSCNVEDVFQQPELTQARLEFEQLYPKIIKPFHDNNNEFEEEENEVQDFMENIEECEDEHLSEPNVSFSEPIVSLGHVLTQWIDEELDKSLPPDNNDVEDNDEANPVLEEKKSDEELIIKSETNEFGKEKVDNLYKIFLDRYRATRSEKCESVCSEEICKQGKI